MAMYKERCLRDRLETAPDDLAQQFRLQMHCGISNLAGNKELHGADDLVSFASSVA